MKTEVFAEQTAASFPADVPRPEHLQRRLHTDRRSPGIIVPRRKLWRRVAANGDIYKGDYEGWYCTVDEIFVPRRSW
jgi:hypothetical protein